MLCLAGSLSITVENILVKFTFLLLIRRCSRDLTSPFLFSRNPILLQSHLTFPYIILPGLNSTFITKQTRLTLTCITLPYLTLDVSSYLHCLGWWGCTDNLLCFFFLYNNKYNTIQYFFNSYQAQISYNLTLPFLSSLHNIASLKFTISVYFHLTFFLCFTFPSFIKRSTDLTSTS